MSEPTLHGQTGAESSLDGSDSTEAARSIETFRVRVADDVQDARGALACEIGAMFDQQSAHALFPEGRLDEQRIELGIAVRSRQDRCEADDHAGALRNQDVTIRDLLDRQRDRVRVRE